MGWRWPRLQQRMRQRPSRQRLRRWRRSEHLTCWRRQPTPLVARRDSTRSTGGRPSSIAPRMGRQGHVGPRRRHPRPGGTRVRASACAAACAAAAARSRCPLTVGCGVQVRLAFPYRSSAAAGPRSPKLASDLEQGYVRTNIFHDLSSNLKTSSFRSPPLTEPFSLLPGS